MGPQWWKLKSFIQAHWKIEPYFLLLDRGQRRHTHIHTHSHKHTRCMYTHSPRTTCVHTHWHIHWHTHTHTHTQERTWDESRGRRGVCASAVEKNCLSAITRALNDNHPPLSHHTTLNSSPYRAFCNPPFLPPLGVSSILNPSIQCWNTEATLWYMSL